MNSEERIGDHARSSLIEFGEALPFEFGEFGGGYSEVDNMSPEDIMMISFQNEPIKKCSTLLAPAPAPDMFETHLDEPKEYIVERPSLKRQSSYALSSELMYHGSAAPTPGNNTQSCGGVPIPEIPLLLMPTHFEAEMDIELIVTRITELLDSVPGVSFEHKKENFEWNIYYLNGPSHCKMQVHVYAGFSSGYVVEGNRLNGDSSLFRSLYCSVKAELEQTCEEVAYDSFTVFTPAPSPPELLSSSGDLHGLGPIFRMAQSPFAEARLEAARTLCELSNEENVRSQLVSLGGVSVLLELLTSAPANTEWVQQHALLALANVSDCAECHLALIESGLAPVLLTLCCDGFFQTGELRVLGAYILANLCGVSSQARAIAQQVGKDTLKSWVAKVDYLSDERVRLHSVRARDSLIVCL